MTIRPKRRTPDRARHHQRRPRPSGRWCPGRRSRVPALVRRSRWPIRSWTTRSNWCGVPPGGARCARLHSGIRLLRASVRAAQALVLGSKARARPGTGHSASRTFVRWRLGLPAWVVQFPGPVGAGDHDHLTEKLLAACRCRGRDEPIMTASRLPASSTPRCSHGSATLPAGTQRRRWLHACLHRSRRSAFARLRRATVHISPETTSGGSTGGSMAAPTATMSRV